MQTHFNVLSNGQPPYYRWLPGSYLLLFGGIWLICLWAEIQCRQQQSRAFPGCSSTGRWRPAIELVYINESIRAKRLLIENQLMDGLPISAAALAEQLKHYDHQIQERISQYRKTKRTTDEIRWLNAFNKKWKQGQDLERSMQDLLIAGQHAEARQVFQGPGELVFEHSVRVLHELAQIQPETGRKTVKEVHQMAAGESLNVILLTAVSLLVGLVILGLIDDARLVRRPV